MTSYSVKRTTGAAPEAIWELLVDAPKYPEWNPAVERVEGSIAPGESLKLYTTANPGRAFKLKVTDFTPHRSMVWAGGMPLGLFKGVRTYTLTPGEDGQTEFAMEEVFSGLMEPLISRSIPDLTESFEQFADGLKQAAEAA